MTDLLPLFTKYCVAVMALMGFFALTVRPNIKRQIVRWVKNPDANLSSILLGYIDSVFSTTQKRFLGRSLHIVSFSRSICVSIAVFAIVVFLHYLFSPNQQEVDSLKSFNLESTPFSFGVTGLGVGIHQIHGGGIYVLPVDALVLWFIIGNIPVDFVSYSFNRYLFSRNVVGAGVAAHIIHLLCSLGLIVALSLFLYSCAFLVVYTVDGLAGLADVYHTDGSFSSYASVYFQFIKHSIFWYPPDGSLHYSGGAAYLYSGFGAFLLAAIYSFVSTLAVIINGVFPAIWKVFDIDKHLFKVVGVVLILLSTPFFYFL